MAAMERLVKCVKCLRGATRRNALVWAGAGPKIHGMNRVISDRERAQRAGARLRVLQHFDQVTHTSLGR